MTCKCMKFASKSAIESESSANAGSKTSKGTEDAPVLERADTPREEREEGRRGVVGRDMGPRDPEVGRLALLLARGVVDAIVFCGGRN